MNDKEIWDHINKELAKANTVIRLSKKLLASVLFKRARYSIFTVTILDSFTREIFLTSYSLFDQKYSWSLYNLLSLTSDENKVVDDLKREVEKYIKVRHQEIGHSSRKVKTEDHRRIQWLPETELDKIEEIFKKIHHFLSSYGMRNFNEGYSMHYGGPDTSLQCLIEDLEKLKNM